MKFLVIGFVNLCVDILKAVVLDWPLNIYTYNSCQKEFPQDICKIFTVLNHSMCEYFNLKFGVQDSKFPLKSMGIYKFLSLWYSEMISNTLVQ